MLYLFFFRPRWSCRYRLLSLLKRLYPSRDVVVYSANYLNCPTFEMCPNVFPSPSPLTSFASSNPPPITSLPVSLSACTLPNMSHPMLSTSAIYAPVPTVYAIPGPPSIPISLPPCKPCHSSLRITTQYFPNLFPSHLSSVLHSIFYVLPLPLFYVLCSMLWPLSSALYPPCYAFIFLVHNGTSDG